MKHFKFLVIGIVLFLSGCGGIEPVNDPPEFVSPQPNVEVDLDEIPVFTTWAFGEDEQDGKLPCNFDISEVNFNVPGTYTATCTVTDADGDVATGTVEVTVVDKTPPKVEKMSSHKSEYRINTEIDFESNILITDNYDEELDVVIDDSDVVYDTPGTYDVEYTATDDAGNATSLVVEYTLTRMVVPTFTEEISADQSHLLIDYEVVDPDGAFLRVDVKVEKGEEEFMVDSFFDVTYEIEIPVPSNSQFKVTLTYLYDMGDDEGERQRRKEEEIMSDSWEIPELEIETTYSSRQGFDLEVFYIDPDTRVLDAFLTISDMSGELYIYEILMPEVIPVWIPFTGRDYTIVLTYTYDMDDGDGMHEVVVQETYINPQIPIPEVHVLYNPIKANSVVIGYQVEGFEYIVSPYIEVSLCSAETLIPFDTLFFMPDEMPYIEFINLYGGNDYVVTFSYEYDLFDGQGVQHMEYEYMTHTSVTEIETINPLNPVLVMNEDLYVYLEISPNGMLLTGVEINGAYLVNAYLQSEDVYQFSILHTELFPGVNHLVITGLIMQDGPFDIFVDMTHGNTFSVTVVVDPI